MDDLTRFSLPLAPIEEPVWTRQNGQTTFTVTGAVMQRNDGSTYMEVPSGKYARAALFYLCTLGRISGKREIPLGDSYRSFLSRVGLSWSGSTSAREAIRQLELVAGSGFSVHTTENLEQEGESVTRRSADRVNLADKTEFWLPTKLEDRLVKNSQVVLSEPFHLSLAHAVPVPTAAWKHLMAESKSALPLDVYLWLCARLYKITRDSYVSWDQIHSQFGSTASLRHFKPKFRSALALVMEVYPEARIYEQVPTSQRKGFSGFSLKRGSGSAIDSRFVMDSDPADASIPLPEPHREDAA
ncbi:replication protein RepA [Nesterenkonia sp. CF4.4]|uniref:replication protein RepA n=1 Tax=Nesterenkonia sp. CF4.4 TaxID=3373079 RepID=UPI003EE42796